MHRNDVKEPTPMRVGGGSHRLQSPQRTLVRLDGSARARRDEEAGGSCAARDGRRAGSDGGVTGTTLRVVA